MGDPGGELAGDGERLRLAELALEVERVLALQQDALAPGLELLGHAVERLGHRAELVAALDRQRRPRTSLAERADRSGQPRERAQELALQDRASQEREGQREESDAHEDLARGRARARCLLGGEGDLDRAAEVMAPPAEREHVHQPRRPVAALDKRLGPAALEYPAEDGGELGVAGESGLGERRARPACRSARRIG